MTEKEKRVIENTKQFKADYPNLFKRIMFVGIASLVIPIVIWFVYLVGHFWPLIPTDISAGELLSFWGTVLSFIGTICLGALALWQNIKANSISKRLSLIERERFKLDLQPFVLLTDWKIQEEEWRDVTIYPKKLYFSIGSIEDGVTEYPCLSLKLTNTSNTYTMVSYSGAEVYKIDANKTLVDKWGVGSSNQKDTKLYLESGHTDEIVFYCSKEKMKSFQSNRVRIEFILSNRFDEKYKETFDIIVLSLGDNYNEGWYVSLNPQNYRIEKYDKEREGYYLEDEDD